MDEPSNKTPLIILVIVVVLLLILLLVWQFWDGKSVNDQGSNTDSYQPRIWTEEEKNQIRSLQFATTSGGLIDPNTPAGKKVEQQINAMMESYQPPPLSLKEREAIIKMTSQHY